MLKVISLHLLFWLATLITIAYEQPTAPRTDPLFNLQKGINADIETYKRAIFYLNKTKVDNHNANPNVTYEMVAN